MRLQFKCVHSDIAKTKGYRLPQNTCGYAAESRTILMDVSDHEYCGMTEQTVPSPLCLWHAGKVHGRSVRARGRLLDPVLTAQSRGGGRTSGSKGQGRVDIVAVRDWVIDHTEPAAIWIISGTAWYRCIPMTPPGFEFSYWLQYSIQVAQQPGLGMSVET